MNLVVLDDYLAACQEACEGEIRRLYAPPDGAPSTLFDLILDYPLRGGKALRPTLSIAMCLGLGGQLEAVLPTAATLELYHNAFLVHDDIEDESLLRRGAPTLHVDHGIPVAVNVGDAMLSLSLQPLLDNVERVGLGPALRILQAIAHMTRRTVEGQATELDWVRDNAWQLDDGDYLAMVEHKTSWYSFITPLQVGAVAAAAGPAEVAALEPLGRHLGAAFQITDDLLNLRADPEDYGKEIGGDLWEGKRTLMLLHALRSARPDDRERALAILGRPRPLLDGSGTDVLGLLDHLVACGDLAPAGRDALRAALPTGAPTPPSVWTTSAGCTTCCCAMTRSATRGRSPPAPPERRPPRSPVWTGFRRAATGTSSPGSSTTSTSAPGEHPVPRRRWAAGRGAPGRADRARPGTGTRARPARAERPGCPRPRRTAPDAPCTTCSSTPSARCSAIRSPRAGYGTCSWRRACGTRRRRRGPGCTTRSSHPTPWPSCGGYGKP